VKRSFSYPHCLSSPSWRTVLVLIAGAFGVSGISARAIGPLPCDIYAAGGTPCVAAYSTVHALFSAYNGNLYQVERASDNATLNIGTLSAGGYVHTPDNPTNASTLPLVVGRHHVYGLYMVPGTRYRDDHTSGIATGDNPEGKYAIFDGTHYNNGCCLDYGNAETSNNNEGVALL
jgi:hypothetical protein